VDTVDNGLDYTDGSTGYAGSLLWGLGGLGHGSGSYFGWIGDFAIGFKLRDANGAAGTFPFLFDSHNVESADLAVPTASAGR